jgi:hypothetical protein
VGDAYTDNKKIEELLETGVTQVVVGSPMGLDVAEAIKIVERTSSRVCGTLLTTGKVYLSANPNGCPAAGRSFFTFFAQDSERWHKKAVIPALVGL